MCIYERLGLSPALSRLYASVGLYFLGPVLMFICPGGGGLEMEISVNVWSEPVQHGIFSSKRPR